MKEELIDWYDLSRKEESYEALLIWIEVGKSYGIPELDKALKTFENWTTEMSNYHFYRFTNASVEGRNNRIKALMRRSYCLPNRTSYENRIYQECNKEYLPLFEDVIFS